MRVARRWDQQASISYYDHYYLSMPSHPCFLCLINSSVFHQCSYPEELPQVWLCLFRLNVRPQPRYPRQHVLCFGRLKAAHHHLDPSHISSDSSPVALRLSVSCDSGLMSRRIRGLSAPDTAPVDGEIVLDELLVSLANQRGGPLFKKSVDVHFMNVLGRSHGGTGKGYPLPPP